MYKEKSNKAAARHPGEAAPGASSWHRPGGLPYFRRVWTQVVATLLAVSFIPLIVVGVVMYMAASNIVGTNLTESLRTDVIRHKAQIDRFLADRLANLKTVGSLLGAGADAHPEDLSARLAAVHATMPWFVDLGIVAADGAHLAYSGPYVLESVNYSTAAWFAEVCARQTHVSDVFYGHRGEPHFVAAVTVRSPAGFVIVRGTVDAAFFTAMVNQVAAGHRGESFLVNGHGLYQTRPRLSGELMEPAGIPDPGEFQGVKILHAGNLLYMMVRLDQTPWTCVVRADKHEVYAPLARVRNVGLFVFLLGGILIVFTVLYNTNALVLRLESKRQSIRMLNLQLRLTAQMATALELSRGVFAEVKDALANMASSAAWLAETGDPEERRRAAEEIGAQARETTAAVDAFLEKARPDAAGPLISETRMDQVADEVLGVLSHDLEAAGIQVRRHVLGKNLTVRTDPVKLRHVLQNVVKNALDAMEGGGVLSVDVRQAEHGVEVVVSDTGPGIPEDIADRIFDPLVSTRPGAHGLGLSLAHTLLESVGGTIRHQRRAGAGASFVIEVPYRFTGIES